MARFKTTNSRTSIYEWRPCRRGSALTWSCLQNVQLGQLQRLVGVVTGGEPCMECRKQRPGYLVVHIPERADDRRGSGAEETRRQTSDGTGSAGARAQRLTSRQHHQ